MTDTAERTAMRNVLAALLQNAAVMRQKEVQPMPGERACKDPGYMVWIYSEPWPCNLLALWEVLPCIPIHL